jgi:hypothetical protein
MKFFSKHAQAMFIFVALVLVFGLMLQSQGRNQRVDNFLNSLPTLANIDLARSAVQNLRFTEAEIRQLEGALKQPTYRAQIDRLLGTAKVPPGPLPPPVKDASILKQEQIQRIGGINLKLKSEAQQLMTLSAKVSGTALTTIIGTAPKITSLSQATIEPGQQLIIRGTDFLPQGSVTFTFGSSVFNGAVVYWANDFILVTLPADIQGVREMDGNVTVKKQNARRADAAIRFVPIWDYAEIWSARLTYSDNPYDGAVAFFLWVVKGVDEWCSQFNIPWAYVTNPLLNTWRITGVRYANRNGSWLRSKNENPGVFVGSANLPDHTTGSLCFYIMKEARITCEVTVKGPLGLKYYQ